MDFHGIDLNLLVAFNALIEERNVTRAASHVGVSQPAMSAALGRLRTLFGDPLFQRGAEGLQPTARARELAVPVANVLRQLEETLITRPVFDPTKVNQTFRLGLSEYPAYVLLPLLSKTLERQAPGITLNVLAISHRDDAVTLLDAGKIDAAIGVPTGQQDNRILSHPLLQDEFVTLLRRDHPLAGETLDLATFLALRHVLVSPEGDGYGLVDQALDRQGLRRTCALTLPQMFAAPAIVAASDMSTTVMKRVAQYATVSGQLAIYPPPLALPVIPFDLIWHRRHETSSAQRWLRALITSLAASLY
ncbi:LysR family transcriptional regulator [Erwinia typographi]|uniref:LysR family transcriptional regulator n=2 Tax=Erwinia typographi TaxID=371042 RepID=A0A0A3YVB2_9GAMM|nr:LysR family transcriptional regulator [Erwinia typographi]KGT90520.1 LysR family transcriptional regulator [Erwinia typographi]